MRSLRAAMPYNSRMFSPYRVLLRVLPSLLLVAAGSGTRAKTTTAPSDPGWHACGG